MAGGIFLIQDEQLIEMMEEVFESEDRFQALLARYPNLLAGNQIDAVRPRRWLLISREVGVPDEEQAADRWSLDHLFLDQDAIPTLVEVKRSTDTRIRREVVGQMLDYAANGVAHWPVEEMKAKFEARCQVESLDPEQELAAFLRTDGDASEFWEKAKTNLKAGKIRLLFVADKIPPELIRIIEFLNWQMDPAEVLAVEIKQYRDDAKTTQTLVPRIYGRVEKGGSTATSGELWTQARFFERLQDFDVTLGDPAHRIMDWAVGNELFISWGRGKNDGSFTVSVLRDGTRYAPFNIWTQGKVQMALGNIMAGPPFDQEEERLDLLARLNQIPGVQLPPDANDKYPSFQLAALRDPAKLKSFLETMEWLFEKIRAES